MKKILLAIILCFATFFIGCTASELDTYVEKSTFKFDLENKTELDGNDGYYEVTGNPEKSDKKTALYEEIVFDDKDSINQIYLSFVPEDVNSSKGVLHFEKESKVLTNYIESLSNSEVSDEIDKLIRKFIYEKDVYYFDDYESSLENTKCVFSEKKSLANFYYVYEYENIYIKLTLTEGGGMNIFVKK